ncbi:hypothetical protein DSCO28_57780 [Desulfosarcina ovata subsp. sediminis]|uniref:Uncharacterized protein n=2 Tax=Desulfosarcina ovata TaxID=83564 RepID=A0A5K8AI08_9BACT|nr:hypothetical protein DSCO28_57780 [Desulfosarcina ovata subsp. sediminis]BBO92106.1 hypothetical protein DSCOOX_52860 [Desulfosarcina ovata subsp. ovata]
MNKHAKLIRLNPNDDWCEREQDQGRQDGTDRRGRCRLPDGYALLFHEIDLDHTAAGGKWCDVGYKDIHKDQLDNISKRDAKPHRPDHTIQPQTIGQEI